MLDVVEDAEEDDDGVGTGGVLAVLLLMVLTRPLTACSSNVRRAALLSYSMREPQ